MQLTDLLTRFESGFLLSARIVFSVLVLLSFLLLVVSTWLLTDSVLLSHSPTVEELFETPKWSEVRTKILPVRTTLSETVEQSNSAPIEQEEPEVDQEIMQTVGQIIESLNEQFSADESANYGSYISAGLLYEWLMNEVPIRTQAKFVLINSLADVADEIAEDPVIARVGNVKSRVDNITLAIQTYTDDYVAAYASAEKSATQALAQEELERKEKTLYMAGYLGGSLILFFLLALIVVIMRTELHLKEIASHVK